MIYEVTLTAPAINETVVTEAANREEAIERATVSAVTRMLEEGKATVKVIPVENN